MFDHSNLRQPGRADEEQERCQQHGRLLLPRERDDGAELQLRAMPLSFDTNPVDGVERLLCDMWRGRPAEEERGGLGSQIFLLQAARSPN